MRFRYEVRNDKLLIQNYILLFQLQFLPIMMNFKKFTTDIIAVLILVQCVNYSWNFFNNFTKSPVYYRYANIILALLTICNIASSYMLYIDYGNIKANFKIENFILAFALFLMIGTFYLEPFLAAIIYFFIFFFLQVIHIMRQASLKKTSFELDLMFFIYMFVVYNLGFHNVLLYDKKSKWRKTFFFTSFFITQMTTLTKDKGYRLRLS